MCRPWSRPVTDCLDLSRVHGHAIGRDDVPQVVDGVDAKSTLGALDVEVVLLEGGEDQAQVAQVVRPRVAVDEDVVEEDEDEAMEERAQYLVHERLERGRGIA